MSFSQHDLEAYLDEALPAETMARVEENLRADSGLLAQLAAINARRDGGAHSLGAIWRRHRLSCPGREQLGSFLLTTLPQGQQDYIAFHLDQVGCRACQANLDDLKTQQAESPAAAQQRRRKYFESSAGFLRAR